MPREIRWSNSSLTTLQMCGEKFRRRYVEGEWVPSSPAAVRGTVVHKVAATALLRKQSTRELPTVEEARDLAADEFEIKWRSGVKLTDEETALGMAKVAAESKDFAIDLAGFHVERVAPAINPIGVERKITIKPKDSDITILGTIDLIDAPTEGQEIIRDLKTTQKAPQANAADTSQQLTFEGLIRLAEVGRLPTSFALDFLVRTPERKERKHVPLTTERTREDVGALVNRINTAVAAVKKGIFVPANPDWWGCSRNWCEFYETCAYVRRGESRPRS